MICARLSFLAASGLLLILTSGCITIQKEMTIPTQHVVMFDSDGKPVDPTGNVALNRHTDLWPYPQMSQGKYEEHMDNVFAHISKHPLEDGKRKILIFIHGGLNTQVDSLNHIMEKLDGKERYKHIIDEHYFPIFINWKSSLWSSYFDHLLFVRQGERWNFLAGVFTAPVVLTVDIGRSILRAPLVWGALLRNDFKTVPYLNRDSSPSYPDEIATELLCRYRYKGDSICTDTLKFKQPPYCAPIAFGGTAGQRPSSVTGPEENTYPIVIGEDERRCSEMDAHFAAYVVTLPFKMLTAPVLDAFGTSAWDNMERRIQLLFSSEEELKRSDLTKAWKDRKDLAHLPASGGLAQFLQEMVKHANTDKRGGVPWEIVIVGHSMGTIVANEIIRDLGGELPIHDVVYLAGATTVRDYEDTMYPYLRRLPDTRLYQFTLHPEAESGEIYDEAFDLAPRGSLLVWLDSFLANPLTLRDRTVGRYNNLLAVAHLTPERIRPQISIRTFSAGWAAKKNNPQTHSDVAGRFRFWKSECWQPEAPLDACFFTPQ